MRDYQPTASVGPRWRKHFLRALIHRTAASNGLTSDSASRTGASCDVPHRWAHCVADSVAAQSRYDSEQSPRPMS